MTSFESPAHSYLLLSSKASRGRQEETLVSQPLYPQPLIFGSGSCHQSLQVFTHSIVGGVFQLVEQIPNSRRGFLQAALERMTDFRVRRLPVVASDGELQGMLSVDDIIMWGVDQGGVRSKDLVRALRAICSGRVPPPKVVEPIEVS